MDFAEELHLSQPQAEIIARSLYSVARAEGNIRHEEATLIRSFFREVSDGGNLAAIATAPEPEGEALAATLGTGLAPPAMLFLKTCLLLSYVDGDYHPKERAVVERFAKALAVSPETLRDLEHSVKDYLLSSLSHLSNVEATSQVAKKLQL